MIVKRIKSHFKTQAKGIDFYSLDGMDIIHCEMLRLLKIIDKVCKAHNLSYWMDGGSMIGVVRHKGFIPWDDDLDISLLKADYLKLLELLQTYFDKEDAFLFFPPRQKWHSCNFFASSKIYGRIYGSSILIPVKIDIRPLNSYPNSEDGIKKNLINRDTANVILYNYSKGYCSVDEIQKKSMFEKEFFFDYYNNNYGIKNDEDMLLSHPYFEFSNQFPLRLSNIFPLEYFLFEDMMVPIPKDYEYLLTKLYGDFMSLPPLDNRAPVMCQVYRKDISLHKAITNAKYLCIPQQKLCKKILRKLFQIHFIGLMNTLNIRFHEQK